MNQFPHPLFEPQPSLDAVHDDMLVGLRTQAQCLAYSAKEKQSSSECDLRATAERLRYQLPREKVVGLA